MGIATFCLLTDFGLTDHYVGTMKGVLISKLPDAQIIDINHNIPAQDIRAAAYELLVSYSYQPHGAIFVCVVDPGVGSDRPILLAHAGPWWFIAPDNGLLSWVLEIQKPTELYHIPVPDQASHTFHGRDVMAPVAIQLAQGVAPSELGRHADHYAQLPFPVVLKHGSMWQGEVLAIDVFGNLITNVRIDEIKPYARSSKLWIEFDKNSTTIRGLSTTYSAVDVGKLCAIEGSHGYIEIAVNGGNAAASTALAIGDRVTFHFRT